VIAHTTPNGQVLVLSKGEEEPSLAVATPVNRMGVLEWLLQNGANKEFVTKVTTFLNAEYEAARRGTQERTELRKKVKRVPSTPEKK
jgi:hypothetical protein